MDPDEARRRLNELLTDPYSANDLSEASAQRDEIVELWQALDSWLSGGGFLPSPWAR